MKYNFDVLMEYLVTKIPIPKRKFIAPPRMVLIRSFDFNKPWSEEPYVKGGVAGGSILKLYVFSAPSYKQEERCVRNVAVITDHASLGTEPAAEEVQDCERTPKMRFGQDDDIVCESTSECCDVGEKVNLCVFLEEVLVLSVCGASPEYTDDGEMDQEQNFES